MEKFGQSDKLRWGPGRPDSLFERIGGRRTLEIVHKTFYTLVYAHPWLGKYFAHRERSVLEEQQSDFMSQNFGGPKVYCGAFPEPAHKHMFVSQELFDIRNDLLSQAITKAGVPDKLKEEWLRIDYAFAGKIVKKSEDECTPRYVTDDILSFPDTRP